MKDTSKIERWQDPEAGFIDGIYSVETGSPLDFFASPSEEYLGAYRRGAVLRHATSVVPRKRPLNYSVGRSWRSTTFMQRS